MFKKEFDKLIDIFIGRKEIFEQPGPELSKATMTKQYVFVNNKAFLSDFEWLLLKKKWIKCLNFIILFEQFMMYFYVYEDLKEVKTVICPNAFIIQLILWTKEEKISLLLKGSAAVVQTTSQTQL